MPRGINHLLGSHHFSFQVVDIGCGDPHRNHGASAGGSSVAARANSHFTIHIGGKAQAAANQLPAAGVFQLHQHINDAAHPSSIAFGADGLLGFHQPAAAGFGHLCWHGIGKLGCWGAVFR